MPKWTFASLRITNQTAFDWTYAATHDITVHKTKGINGTEHLNFYGTIIPGETKEVQLSAEHQYGQLVNAINVLLFIDLHINISQASYL